MAGDKDRPRGTWPCALVRIWPAMPCTLEMALAMTGAAAKEPRSCGCPPSEAALICGKREPRLRDGDGAAGPHVSPPTAGPPSRGGAVPPRRNVTLSLDVLKSIR